MSELWMALPKWLRFVLLSVAFPFKVVVGMAALLVLGIGFIAAIPFFAIYEAWKGYK